MLPSLSDKLEIFNADLPLERASTIPRLWYCDTDVFDAERDAVFGNSWLAVGRLDQVEEPGSYFTIDAGGDPILVARDKAGQLNAFSNVCRHRAARVATGACGKASFFQCRYHGWTYDLSGSLKGTPEFDGIVDFSRDKTCLPRLSLATWGPFIFVHLSSNPPPLSDLLAPLAEKVKPEAISTLKFVERREYDIQCNWKVFVDNYLDGGYHVNTIHPSLSKVLDYSKYKSEIFTESNLQWSPIQADRSGDESVSNVRKGSAYYWWSFPNFMLNLYDGVMDTNVVWPVGPDRCRVIFDFFFAETEGEKAKSFISQSMAVAHQVQVEDVDICEDVQRGLKSKRFDTGRFSVRREIAGHHFHRLLAKKLRAMP